MRNKFITTTLACSLYENFCRLNFGCYNITRSMANFSHSLPSQTEDALNIHLAQNFLNRKRKQAG
jgi:hypothetical protein